MYNNRLLPLGFFVLCFLVCCIFPSCSLAQIIINEFSSASNPEWVELYNSGGESVDLSGWSLSDEVQNPKILSGTILPGGYFVYENSTGWLNNTGYDLLSLKDNQSLEVDLVTFGDSSAMVLSPNGDKSAGRSPNTGTFWVSNLIPTKGSTNPDPTPTPTPTPSPTQSSTNSPTPTATSTSTPIPTFTPTPSPTVLRTKTPKPTVTSSPTIQATDINLVLGASNSAEDYLGLNSLDTNSDNLDGEKELDSKSISPVSYLLIGGGVFFILSGLLLYWKRRPDYNKKDEIQN